jgi:hypothetical protein
MSLALLGCGGGGSKTSTVGVPATVTLSPLSVSLNPGQVGQVIATVFDAKNIQVFTSTVTYQSSNPDVTISKIGQVCAGQWDASFVVCSPKKADGTALLSATANITATASGISSTSPTVVSVHPVIDNITIDAPATDCFSQTETGTYTAHVFSGGVDITSQVGGLNWVSSDPSIATVDTTVTAATNTVTSVKPGRAQISVSVSNVTGLPALFTACAPASIQLATNDAARLTSFTLALGSTQSISASLVDVHGKAISIAAFPLRFSSIPAVASASAAGTVTPVGPGTTSIVASCSPPFCNAGVNQPVYSNPVVVTVTGTSATTAYATGSGATTIVPVDTTAGTAGTAITIPTVAGAQPVINSMVFAPQADAAYIGSDLGFFILDAANAKFASVFTGLNGRVLAVSPDGNLVIIANTTAGTVSVFNFQNSQTQSFAFAGANAAAFSRDRFKAYITSSTAGSVLTFSPVSGFKLIAAGSFNDVDIIPQNSLAYLGAASIASYAICNDQLVNAFTPAAPALKVRATEDSRHVLAVDGTSITDDSFTLTAAGCPVTATDTPATHSFGQGAFTPTGMAVTSDSAHAYVFSNLPQVLAYDVNAGTTSTITLTGAVTGAVAGGVTLDSKTLFVGAAGTNDVHIIDTATGTDTKQIAVGLKKADGSAVAPDIIAVRPK